VEAVVPTTAIHQLQKSKFSNGEKKTSGQDFGLGVDCGTPEPSARYGVAADYDVVPDVAAVPLPPVQTGQNVLLREVNRSDSSWNDVVFGLTTQE